MFWRVSVVFLVSCWLLLGFVRGAQANQFLPPEKAFQIQVVLQDYSCKTNCLIDVKILVEPKYYLYREKFSLKFDSAILSAKLIGLPRGVVKYDQFLEKEIEALRGELDFQVTYSFLNQNVPSDLAKVQLESQGCADAGLCYPPQLLDIHLDRPALLGGFFDRFSDSSSPLDQSTGFSAFKQSVSVGDQDESSGRDVVAPSVGELNEVDAVFSKLSDQSLLVVLPIFFGLGLLLAFTPCTLPMLPILTSLVIGDSRSSSEGWSRWRALSLALAYVIGMAVTYAVLGVLAGLTGHSLVVALQTPIVLWSFGALIGGLGLLLLKGYQLQIPGQLQSWLHRKANRFRGGRYLPVFVMGMISALLLGPCVAPPLAGALLYIGQTGDALVGGCALFLLALGMGFPMVLIAAGAGSVLPTSGQWMHATNSFFGFVLIAVSFWVIHPVTDQTVLFVFWTLWLFVVSAAIHVFVARYSFETSFIESIWRGLGMLFQFLALVYLLGLFSQAPSLLNPLSQLVGSSALSASASQQSIEYDFERIDSAGFESFLQIQNKPVVLDFYADWCVACIEFKLLTLPDQDVQALLRNFVMVQVDVTKNTASDQALMKQYGLFGPPALLFFDASGRELQSSRVVGFQNADKFSATLKTVREQFNMSE